MKVWSPKVRAIIAREYLQRVRSRWFLFSTFGMPLLVIGLGALSGYLVTRTGGGASQYRPGIVDRSGQLTEAVIQELAADSVYASAATEFADLPDDSLPVHLLSSDYDLLLVLPAGLLAGESEDGVRTARVLAKDNVGQDTRVSLQRAVTRALVRARLQKAGLEGVDTRALLRRVSLDVVSVSEEGTRSQELFQVISFIIAFMFYFVLIVYGQMIVRSILEEKTSDIVEVMVSSVRPWELMLGKIVGVGAVGLTQIAIWVIVITGAALYGLTAGAAALSEAGIDLSQVAIPPGTILGILLFLILGYLLYAGLFAGAGATLSNEHDAQQAALPVVLLIVIPFIAVQGVIQNPDASWSVILSLIPFFSPLLMPSRLMITAVPAWQWASAVALLVGSIILVARLAGRIYRVGILMKGKRPNLPELVRWVRHG
ncbi:MAG: ABC transporter permease [Gemmatimonadota bacterium]